MKNKLGYFLHWSDCLLGSGISPHMWNEHPHMCKENISSWGLMPLCPSRDLLWLGISWSTCSLTCVSGWPASKNIITNYKAKRAWKPTVTWAIVYLFKQFFLFIHFGRSHTGNVGFPGGSEGKASACNAGDLGLIPGSGRPLEKEMATHSSILAWWIPWTEEPGRLQSMGSQRVGHDWVTSLSLSRWKYMPPEFQEKI